MYNNLITIGGLTIHSYGLMIAIGFIAAVLTGTYQAKKFGYDKEIVFDIGLYGIIAGFLGAKLLYLIVEWKEFIKNPGKVIGSNGFVVYGGLVFGILAAVLYCRYKKANFFEYFNFLAPSIALAQGFGRIGCFLAGCCYGKETHSIIGVKFPEESFAPSGVKLIPTQLISVGGDFLIAAILFLYYNKAKQKSRTASLYLILYGIGRFVIEIFRDDYRGTVGPLSTSQFISILFILTGIVFIIKTRKKKSEI